MNKIRKIELIIFIMFVCNASVIEGSGTGYKSGEAFLQTVDEIESWVMRSSIVETGQAWFDELAQEYSISSMRSVDISCTVEANFYHIIFDGTLNVMDLCNDFNVQEEVVIESWPVMIIEYYQDPNDPGFETQWGLGKIDATSAWEYESGNSSVIIGILDSGADVYDIENQQSTVHPDLLQNLWNENGLFGINVGQPGSRPIDYFGHGTHVAGLAGLILSRFPSYTASDVRNLIRNSAEEIGPYSYSNGWNKYFGYGRINAGYAIAPPSTPSNFYGTGHINQSPTLHWNSVVESDIDHLELKRTVTGQGGGNTVFTLSPGTTQYTDYTVIISRFGPSTIKYKLRSVDYTSQNSGYTNTVTYSGEGLWKQMADFEIIPDEFALHTAYPNPFNPTTSIRFDLPERSKVNMVIYDVLGRTIETLIESTIEPGFHEILWNGKDKNGNPVPTGMYIYQFSAFSEESQTQFKKSNKLVLMK